MPCEKYTRHIHLHLMSASTVQPFRPYPEPGSDTKGTFRPYHFYSNTIRQGSGFHFGFLVPHVLLPLYLAYRLLKMTGFWTSTLQYFIDFLLVPLLQGFSVGGILITFTMRFVSPTGRTINHKKSENAATPSEEKRQKHSEEALWAFIYLGAAT